MTEATCVTCLHWYHMPGTMEPPIGYCHRMPPRPRRHGDREFPQTDATDWCGEHPARKAAPVPIFGSAVEDALRAECGMLDDKVHRIRSELGHAEDRVTDLGKACERYSAEKIKARQEVRAAAGLLFRVVHDPNTDHPEKEREWFDEYREWRLRNGFEIRL
jgi:hypothetical protein